jgi:hypothetical protein
MYLSLCCVMFSAFCTEHCTFLGKSSTRPMIFKRTLYLSNKLLLSRPKPWVSTERWVHEGRKSTPPFMTKFQKLLHSKCHERVNFFGGSFEIFDRKCVYGDAVDIHLNAHIQHLPPLTLSYSHIKTGIEVLHTLWKAEKPATCPSWTLMLFLRA